MAALALFLFGSPRVERDGVVTEIKLRKVMALLAYLAVTGQRYNRDALAELLDPDQDRESARSGIRHGLSNLRGLVGGEWVGSDRNAAWFEVRAGAWVDVLEYRRLLGENTRLQRAGDVAGANSALGDAARLYRGEFLSGFFLKDSPAWEDWQASEAETLHREQAAALGTLARVHEAARDLTQAAEWARQLLAIDPLEESSHRTVMRLLALSGERAAALRQYERCVSLLKKELGQRPEAETENLRAEIASGKVVAAAGAAPAERSGTASKKVKRTSPAAKGVPCEGMTVFLAGEQGRNPSTTFCSIGEATEAALAIVRASDGRDGVAIHSAQIPEGDAEALAAAAARAQLVASAGQPGQILLSEPAARLAREAGKDVAVRSLGAHRLRDLGAPVTLYQLLHPDLPGEFLPLRTLDSIPNNLGIQPTPFFGRDAELAAIVGLIGREEIRFLTLTGPGGTGKTRLALQAAAGVAEDFPDGVWFVDLAALRGPGEVLPALAATLGVQEDTSDQRPLVVLLKDFIGRKRLLVVLDNFEHVLPAARDIAEIAAHTPNMKLVATSREALRVQAEHERPVSPLRLPAASDPVGQVAASEAVQFLLRRAARTSSGFALTEANAAAVAEICQRLDGLPLGLELAAAQLKVFSPGDLLKRLDSMRALRMEGAADLPERQRTLRREIDWSYELLDEEERRLFRRGSVFASGFDIVAAESVCGAEISGRLASLVEKSLVFLETSEGAHRYRMLRTIQDYARDQLARAGEAEATAEKLADFLVRLAEEAEPKLYGPEQAEWLERLDRESSNMTAVLSWLRDKGDRLRGARLAGALGWYWFRRARFSEGRSWLEEFGRMARGEDPPHPRAKLSYFIGCMWPYSALKFDPSEWVPREISDHFRRALRLYKAAGDARGAALSLSWLGWFKFVPTASGEFVNTVDFVAQHADRVASLNRAALAQSEAALALARQSGDPWPVAWCLRQTAPLIGQAGWDRARRQAALAEAVELSRAAGDPFLESQACIGMAELHRQDDPREVARWSTEALRLAEEIDDKHTMFSAANSLAGAQLELGNLDTASEMARRNLRRAVDLGVKGIYLNDLLGALDWIARKQGRFRRAARLWGAAVACLLTSPASVTTVGKTLGMDEAEAQAIYEAGFAMSRDDAIAFALSDLDEPAARQD